MLLAVYGSITIGPFIVGPIEAVLVTIVPGELPAVTVITNLKVAGLPELTAIDAGPSQVNCVPAGALQVHPAGHGVVDVTVSLEENVSVRTGFAIADGPLFVTVSV